MHDSIIIKGAREHSHEHLMYITRFAYRKYAESYAIKKDPRRGLISFLECCLYRIEPAVACQ